MKYYRITKYNPSYRSNTGAYEKNEWTSFSDIGKVFEGHKVTYEEYIHTEDTYINALVAFMVCTKTTAMQVRELEKHTLSKQGAFYTQEIVDTFSTVSNNKTINIESIKNVGRLALREDLWCKLESKNMYVHFGYDYYMYIRCYILCEQAIKTIEASGLFVELYSSPYT